MRYGPVSVDYQVRAARITDVDRLVALSHEAIRTSADGSPMVAADLLRQLVYLPQATVVVAEAGRDVIGGAVLALRPSVRLGGFVGTVDMLMVDRQHNLEQVTEALIEELLRSARNKGCTVVEALRPDDHAERSRLERLGFAGSAPMMRRMVGAGRTAASQS